MKIRVRIMKPIFFALLIAGVLASPIYAQSSPAAAASKAASAPSSTLTKEERDRAVEYLKETRKDFLAATEGLSEAQWKFKAAKRS
jgi:hypothetical protein